MWIFWILVFSGHIFFSIKLVKEAKRRKINYRFWRALCIIGVFFPLISMALIYMLYAIFTGKKDKDKEVSKDTNVSYENVIIPDICPLCKSPNTKKTRECEWCGNKIC